MTNTLSGTFDTLVTLAAATDNPTSISVSGQLNDGVQVSYKGLGLTNAGIVAQGSATAGGIQFLAGGSLANLGSASISGSIGIVAQNAPAGVLNGGTITGYGYPGNGIELAAGGSVTNLNGGTIISAGDFAGIVGYNDPFTVVNAGLITSDIGIGVVLGAGGSVTNQSGGTIAASGSGFAGISGYSGSATIVNAGVIAGPDKAEFGIILGVGTISNGSGASIVGYDAIYDRAGALTVVNAGTISGTGNAVKFAAGYANRLIVAPGAAFAGSVSGGNTIGATAVSTLELAGSQTGTLSGIGTQFIDFAQTNIDAAASWVLSGANTFAAGTTLANAGTVTLQDGSLSDAGRAVNTGTMLIDSSAASLDSLAGTGVAKISGGSTLDVLGTVTAGQTIIFAGGRGILGIDPTAFAGQINGFTTGDTINLTGVTDGLTPRIVSGNTLQIERANHPAVDLTLDPGTDYTGNIYAVSADGAVTEIPCFLRSTAIRTDRGDVAVQDLTVADCVVTWFGQIKPIVWIGTGQVLVSPGQRCSATPVIVRKGALADDVPHQDLRITKGHELFIDGVLIPVEFLINHRSIVWDDQHGPVDYYHIELASHDVLIANGAAAESYRDDGNRWMFRNANSGWDRTSKPPCAPVLTGGPVVDAIWRRLLDRAPPRPPLALTADPDLHLQVDGAPLQPTTRSDQFYIFRLPRSPSTVRIVSRAAAPQQLGFARDPRRLGVALQRIVVRQMTRFRMIEAADERLTEGFHAFETTDNLRWTNGDANLPVALFEGFAGAVELVLHLGGSTRYPASALPVLPALNNVA